MLDELPILTRHAAPNKYDHAPCGTQCVVITSNGEQALYKQINTNPEEPVWEYIGKPLS